MLLAKPYFAPGEDQELTRSVAIEHELGLRDCWTMLTEGVPFLDSEGLEVVDQVLQMKL